MRKLFYLTLFTSLCATTFIAPTSNAQDAAQNAASAPQAAPEIVAIPEGATLNIETPSSVANKTAGASSESAQNLPIPAIVEVDIPVIDIPEVAASSKASNEEKAISKTEAQPTQKQVLPESSGEIKLDEITKLEDKSEQKIEVKQVAKKNKKQNVELANSPEKVESPKTAPKSLLKITDFNSVTAQNSTVWRPASSDSARVQDVYSPNLLSNSDEFDDEFLSNLKIPTKEDVKKAEVKASKKETAIFSDNISIEKNSYKSLDFADDAISNSAAKPVDVEHKRVLKVNANEQIADNIIDKSNPDTQSNEGAAKLDDGFNALDGMSVDETVDSAEIKEIEVDSLDYAANASAGSSDSASVKERIAKKKNFYLRDASMNVDVKEQATNDLSAMKEAYDALQLGQVESAIAFYQKIIAENPSNTKAMFGLATAYHMAGQRLQAKNIYKSIVRMDPKSIQAINNYIVLVGEEGGPKAIKELEKLMVKNPKFALIPAQMATIYFNKKDYEKAADYFAQAVNLDYNNANYRYSLAVTFEKLGAFARARNLYGELIRQGAQGQDLPVDLHKIQERFMEISNQS